MTRRLLCVLANPPLTEGQRTLERVDQLRALLDYDAFTVVNLFSVATRDVTGISLEGQTATPWLKARDGIADAIDVCDAALLAYGVSEPTGAARNRHRDQIRWLYARLASSSMVTHTIGNAPRHPSRWQRWTNRAHPGISFHDALAASVTTTLAAAAE